VHSVGTARVWAAWREVEVLRVQTVSARPIGGKLLDQRQRRPLQAAAPRPSSPSLQRIPHALGRLLVLPAASDCPMHRETGPRANHPRDATTIWPPRSTLAAPGLQRTSSMDTLRRMSACSWPGAHGPLTQRHAPLSNARNTGWPCITVV
jgi:hypothetical protein